MLPITLNAEAAYATKPNIVFPGTQTQATAAETIADTRIEDSLDSFGLDALDISIGAGSIEIGGL